MEGCGDGGGKPLELHGPEYDSSLEEFAALRRLLGLLMLIFSISDNETCLRLQWMNELEVVRIERGKNDRCKVGKVP